MPELTPGLAAEVEHTVNESDSAAHWGSGALPVFSTPALVGLMEKAALTALSGQLDEGKTSVGGHIDVQHLAASPLGARVRARAELTAIQGKQLTFKIQAWDEAGLIGEAVHDRFVVDAERFMSKVLSKKGG
jgi:fluoroacetyl-CoA thioesterase